MKRYCMALDEGTTSARAILFDEKGVPVFVAQKEFRQFYPQAGWVEHDAEEIWEAQRQTMEECLAFGGSEAIAAIGITNQRETTVVWDKNTGKPIAPAIVWQCRRTSGMIESLKADGMAETVRHATGLVPDAYFSATKLKWILDHTDGAREKAARGELLFGTVDTFLLWKLTDGRVHATDRTNASRTMLYNIRALSWDCDLLAYWEVPASLLPEVRPSGSLFGFVRLGGRDVPVSGIAGDQQAALFGQGCRKAGSVKNTYGTGCFLLANTGETLVESRHGLLTTLAATREGENAQYVLEGSVFVGGAVIQWLRDELKILASAGESEACARQTEDNGGVYLVPAFTGLGSPYWDSAARGSFFGLTRGTDRDHMIRAALESIAYQSDDLLAAMQGDMPCPLTSLRVDGGAANNGWLMQFQSDISALSCVRPASIEATAAGTAYLAGLTAGFYESEDALFCRDTVTFVPNMSAEERTRLKNGWHRAVRACRVFSQEE